MPPGHGRSKVEGDHDLVDYIQSSKTAAQSKPARTKSAKVLVHVTVEIGDGRKGTIDVHEGEACWLLHRHCAELRWVQVTSLLISLQTLCRHMG